MSSPGFEASAPPPPLRAWPQCFACLVVLSVATASAQPAESPATGVGVTEAEPAAGSAGTGTEAAGAQATARAADGPSTTADAQRDEIARLHFQTGSAHFATGDYEQAAEEFRKAYALSPRPGLLYNLALSYERLAQLQPAIDAMEGYLAGSEALSVQERRRLEARLARMRERLAAQLAPAAVAQEEAPADAGPAAPTGANAAGGESERPSALSSPWVWVAIGVATSVAVGLAVGLNAGTKQPEPLPTDNALPGVRLRAGRIP